MTHPYSHAEISNLISTHKKKILPLPAIKTIGKNSPLK
jgi:hypothetical protein